MTRASFAIAAATLLGFTTLKASGLHAQDAAREWARFVPRVSVAGAFDARDNGRSDPEMYLGLVSFEWDTRVPRLAVRLDGLYARRDRTTRLAPVCEPTCDPGAMSYAFLSSKVTASGALLGATFDLRERGAFRPYVLGAAGMVRSHDKFTTGTVRALACPTAECIFAAIASPSTQRNPRPLTAAAELGGGMAYSWPWVSVFAEARYLTVGYSNTRGLRGAVPVSLGLRF